MGGPTAEAAHRWDRCAEMPKEREAREAVLSATKPQSKDRRRPPSKFKGHSRTTSLLFWKRPVKLISKGLTERTRSSTEKSRARSHRQLPGHAAVRELSPRRRPRNSDLDKDEKVKLRHELANYVITTVKRDREPTRKPTDEQWTGIQKHLVAQAHETLGAHRQHRQALGRLTTKLKPHQTRPTWETSTMVALMNAYNNAKKTMR